MSNLETLCLRSLKAYKHACSVSYKSGTLSQDVYRTWHTMRQAWAALPLEITSGYYGFHDFLACHDATPLVEIISEFRHG